MILELFLQIHLQCTVIFSCFHAERLKQTVKTEIRLLLDLEEQSDQGLHCLPYNSHLYEVFRCGC